MRITSLWIATLFSICFLQTIYLFFMQSNEYFLTSDIPKENWKELSLALKKIQVTDTHSIDEKIAQLSRLTEDIKRHKELISEAQEKISSEKIAMENFQLELQEELQSAKSIARKVFQEEKKQYFDQVSSLVSEINKMEINSQKKQSIKVSWEQSDWEKQPLFIVFQGFYKTFEWTVDQWFTEVKRPIVILFDKDGSIYKENSIVVVTHLMKNPQSYFDEMERKGIYKYGVFHLGDIYVNQQYQWYKQALFIFRNHWVSNEKWKEREILDIVTEKVHFLPCGSIAIKSIDVIRDGAHILPLDKRTIDFAFLGTVFPYRRKFFEDLLHQDLVKNTSFVVNEMETPIGKFISFFGDFRSDKNLDEFTYRNIISESKFVLCPKGTGSDSFRIYEALELGTIPIIEDGPEHSIPFGENPLPKVPKEDWRNLSAIKNKYYPNNDSIKQLQKKVNNWWIVWKESLRIEIANEIETKIFGSK